MMSGCGGHRSFRPNWYQVNRILGSPLLVVEKVWAPPTPSLLPPAPGKLHSEPQPFAFVWTEASPPIATMNFLRRRLSDSSFVANLPNGYMPDLQRPESSSSSPASPAMERRHPQPLAASFSSPGSSLFSSFSSAMKQTPQAPSGLMEPPTPITPVVQRPRIVLVIDDAHTDWSKYFHGKKVNGDIEIRVEQAEFSELNLAAYVTGGCMVDMQVMRNGTKIV
ncbi:hypothetical protein STEG23_034176, partial [Scotinomys teguina]